MTQKKNELEKKDESTVSERFTLAVMKEFGGTIGPIQLNPLQKKLAQHLYIKIDTTLKSLEMKRAASDTKNKIMPKTWDNINMTKLAVDVVHRIDLGLDALIENHISPIPYFNTKAGKYDLDLRVGFEGKDYYRREMCIDKPIDIVYQLVHETDNFNALMKSAERQVESYDFDIVNPFSRGPVIGGFGYIIYSDNRKNKLVIVTMEDFNKSMSSAKSNEFWSKHPEKMQYKTIVHRTTSFLQMDPAKVNDAFVAVENDDDMDAAIVEAEITDKANKGETLKIDKKEPITYFQLCIEQRACPIHLENVNNCPKVKKDVAFDIHHCVDWQTTKTEKDLSKVIACPELDGKEVTAANCEKCDMLKGCPAHG